MKVYELMEQLAQLPAGAQVKVSMYVYEDMDLFRETAERSLYADIADVVACTAKVYISAADIEGV